MCHCNAKKRHCCCQITETIQIAMPPSRTDTALVACAVCRCHLATMGSPMPQRDSFLRSCYAIFFRIAATLSALVRQLLHNTNTRLLHR